MKNLLFTLLIALSFTCSAQLQRIDPPRGGITQGLDFFNALRGGKTLSDGTQRNGRAIDYRGRAYLNFYKGIEGGIYVEIFPEIGYWSHGIDLGYQINVGSFQIVPSVELQNIQRNEKFDFGQWQYIGLGANTRVRKFFGSSPFFIEGQFNVIYRSDIIDLWGRDALPSGTLPALWESRSFYMSIGYKF